MAQTEVHKSQQIQINSPTSSIALKSFLRHVGKMSDGKLPLKILLVGTPGVGKSSFINSCVTSIAKTKYTKVAQVGPGSTQEQRITRKLTKYSMDGYCQPDKCPDDCLPTFIDMAGMTDVESEEVKRILIRACAGQLPEGTDVTDISKSTKPVERSDLKVDRIIFVASAVENIPKNLIKSVMFASRNCGEKEIPVFGILTKVDKMQDKQKELNDAHKTLANCLDTDIIWVTKIRSYCEEVDPDITYLEKSIPEIDIPIIKFLTTVCNPAYVEVRNLQRPRQVSNVMYPIWLLFYCVMKILRWTMKMVKWSISFLKLITPFAASAIIVLFAYIVLFEQPKRQ